MRARKQDTNHDESSLSAVPEAARLPVVALGASAGGLEALQQLFSHLPAEPGMALVVIQHLDPERPSMLTEVLATSTGFDVVEAKSGMPLEANRVHVIPSGADLAVKEGILTLMPRRKTGRLHLPIDSFFRSLAEDETSRAIGVVLSGSGADGTEGLRAIKAQGGITLAQQPDSAQFPSMPENAIGAGVVDFTGSPELIAGELLRLCRHLCIAADEGVTYEPLDQGSSRKKTLPLVFAALRRHTGIDFSGYKRTTVARRIERRMVLRRVDSLEEYAAVLQDDAVEGGMLAQDMLIHVTSFFRDTDAFNALEEKVFKKLVQHKNDGDPIRIWVPGCATGEEAYALVIGILESLDPKKNPAIKLFGTDLSEEAIEKARQGVYSDSALTDVSPERLARFFERVEGGYRINRIVRDLCVFVKHDLTRDPPFAKLDLISCRNVLIYFDAELQRRVVPMLHYCLNSQGYLFLGQSETVTGFRDLFAPVDKEHRIFVKTGDGPRLAYPLPPGRTVDVRLTSSRAPDPLQRAREAQRQADHLLLARYAPPGVIVNDRLEIIQFRGRTGDYLEPAPGQPQANVLRMARQEVVAHLHDALERAKAEATTIRKRGLRIEIGSKTQVFDLEVMPLAAVAEMQESYFLIVFEDVGTRDAKGSRRATPTPDSEPPPKGDASELERLKAQLTATMDYHQSLLSEHQSVTDELGAANEELVAANEELQATNEELESAQEELQATNEELTTVNDQLRNRNLELDQIANDLTNVFASVDIPVIIVDRKLRVRRFTPTVSAIARFIPEDVGRSIDDLKLKVRVDDLASKIQEVLDDLTPKEWEVQGHDDCWFRLQIRPYRTSDNRLDGAVLSFVDVNALRHAVQDAEGARDYAKSIVETVPAALVVLDSSLRVVSANETFYNTFALSRKTAEGTRLSELSGSHWKRPALLQSLEQMLCHDTQFATIELPVKLSRLGPRIFSLSARRILWSGGAKMALLVIDDITDLRSLENERALLLESEKQARREAERATHAKDLFLATLSHELRTPLSTMLMSAQLLGQIAKDEPRIERPSASIMRAATAQARLIDDLLDVSRIVSGKLMLDLGPVDFAAVVQEAVDYARPAAQSKTLQLKISIDDTIGTVYGDAARLQQIVNNLLTNAIKFTPHDGQISVSLERIDDQAQLTVADTGMGISAGVLSQLFDRFVQADSTVTRTHGGLGLGLSIVHHLVAAHGGVVSANSPGKGKGATFQVTLPLGQASTAKSEGAVKPVAYGIEGVRILFVEDDDDTRDACTAMLTALGAKVRAEPSAAAGITAVGEFRPQVILSDIAMPGEDGYSFIQKVRRLGPEQGGQTPAAAVTALASDDDRQRAMKAGFQIHVAKPVDAFHLATVVRNLLLATGGLDR